MEIRLIQPSDSKAFVAFYKKLTHVAKLTVGVLEDHKRQGIATKLIKFAEKWAKEKGVKRLELTVVTKNKPAVALFQKTGFKEEGTRKKSMNEFLMAKTL